MSKYSLILFSAATLLLSACGDKNETQETGNETNAKLLQGHLNINSRDYTYECNSGEKLELSYVTTGEQFAGMPVFVVIKYKNMHYGFAQAITESGTRYIAPAGLNNQKSLEWFEKSGKATLSEFSMQAEGQSTKLEDCRIFMGV